MSIPAIQQAQQTLGQAGLLYVGDCKMAALSTRAYVQQSGDYHLCPLSGVQVSAATLQELVAPVQANTQPVTTIERHNEEDDTSEAIAVGYEYTRQVTLTQDEHPQWEERVLVVRSLKLAHTQQAALQQRLANAQAELARLSQTEHTRGKKVLRQVSQVRKVVEAIVHRYRVDGLLDVQYHEQIVSERPVRRSRERPAGTHIEREISLSVQVNADAVRRPRPVWDGTSTSPTSRLRSCSWSRRCWPTARNI